MKVTKILLSNFQSYGLVENPTYLDLNTHVFIIINLQNFKIFCCDTSNLLKYREKHLFIKK